MVNMYGDEHKIEEEEEYTTNIPLNRWISLGDSIALDKLIRSIIPQDKLKKIAPNGINTLQELNRVTGMALALEIAPEKEIEIYKKAIEAFPENMDDSGRYALSALYEELASCYERLGETTERDAALKKAKELEEEPVGFA